MNIEENSLTKTKKFKNYVIENFPFLENEISNLTVYEICAKVLDYTKSISNDLDGLQRVAYTGNYEDLINKPIPNTPIIVDSELSTSSSNAIENKAVTNELNKKLDQVDVAAVALSGDYDLLINKPTIPTKISDLANDSDFVTSDDIPTKTSDLTNDSGFIDNTYHDNTKQNKLTAGANITIENNVISATGGGSGGTNDYNDLINKPTIPTKTSDLTNDSDFVNETQLNEKVTKLIRYAGFTTRIDPESHEIKISYSNVNVSSGTIYILEKIITSDYVTNYASWFINLSIGNLTGPLFQTIIRDDGISYDVRLTVDKLLDLTYTHIMYKGTEWYIIQPKFPTKISDLEDDSDFVPSTEFSEVAFTGDYNDLINKPASGSGGTITIDSTLNTDSTNAVENKAITAALNNKVNLGDVSDVGLSGDYDDLLNKPTLSQVATSGSYNDLTNKPVIPEVNNATLTIQKNGTTVKTFTANASSNVTANITVPTKISDLQDDLNLVDETTYLQGIASKQNVITNDNKLDYSLLSNKPTIPTKTSQLTNDSNFVTNNQLPTIDGGNISFGSISGGTVTLKSVTFTQAFAGIPYVVATQHGGSTNKIYGNTQIMITNITTTGFDIRFYNNSSNSLSPTADWIAIK